MNGYSTLCSIGCECDESCYVTILSIGVSVMMCLVSVFSRL